MMKRKKIIKPLIIGACIIVGIIAIRYVFLFVVVFIAFGGFDKIYSADDLIKNFNEKRVEIYAAKKYFNNIVPKYKIVEIEFASDDEIDRLTITPKDTGKGSNIAVEFEDWNLKIKSSKVDSLLLVLGWTHNTLNMLKEKLDDANCILIESGDPAKIGFKRSGLGMYFFDVFDKPIPDSLKTRYNDSCTYIYADKKLVLEYGGGAVGNQCFFNKRK
jgi:hypothetical protein